MVQNEGCPRVLHDRRGRADSQGIHYRRVQLAVSFPAMPPKALSLLPRSPLGFPSSRIMNFGHQGRNLFSRGAFIGKEITRPASCGVPSPRLRLSERSRRTPAHSKETGFGLWSARRESRAPSSSRSQTVSGWCRRGSMSECMFCIGFDTELMQIRKDDLSRLRRLFHEKH